MSKIEEQREELHNYFKSEIIPLIRKNNLDTQFLNVVMNKLNIRFPMKYNFILRTYNNGDVLRISANSKSLGIIYFFAASKTNTIVELKNNTAWFEV
jgi:hypothetical protein